MTRQRNLGPVLAVAGAAIAIIAAIAGFLVVGGPGGAREQRLDELTLGRVNDVLNIAQCAFNETSTAPATLEDARKVRRSADRGNGSAFCDLGTTAATVPASSGDHPAAQGDVTYDALSPTRIRICAHYRRPAEAQGCNGICYDSFGYREFRVGHAAGIHCYEVELRAKTARF